MNFKINDRVKIEKFLDKKIAELFTEDEMNMIIGAVGTISEVDSEYPLPYRIIFDDDTINDWELEWWRDEEISLLDDVSVKQFNVLDVTGLTPFELDIRMNELYKQGYKLAFQSSIEWYQGKGEWGIITFELKGE